MTYKLFDIMSEVNLAIFPAINAGPYLHGPSLVFALFAAVWVITLIPFSMARLWLSGKDDLRLSSIESLTATSMALVINFVIGLLWHNDRPFVVGIGHTYLHHSQSGSFPSNHATIMFTVALVLISSQAKVARNHGLLLFPAALLVAWARVFVGVHWPMDMVGGAIMGATMALLARTRKAGEVNLFLTQFAIGLYRRYLDALIKRGILPS